MTIANKTPADLKRWAQVNRQLGYQLLAARRAAAKARAEVDARAAPIFARYEFRADRTGERITKPSDLYLVADLDDAKVRAYYDELDAANRAAGWQGAPDTCPALCAEHDAIKAEWAIFDAAKEFTGEDFNSARPELRQKALELFTNVLLYGS